jgi:hypothetical protein
MATARQILVWAYTLTTMVLFPTFIYSISPLHHLWWHEYLVVVVYVFTAGCVTAEGFAAIDAARKQQDVGDSVKKAALEDEAAFDQKRIKIAIIVPAYMNNEVDILNETLSAYERAVGKNLLITVWLVFNRSGLLPDAVLAAV